MSFFTERKAAQKTNRNTIALVNFSVILGLIILLAVFLIEYSILISRNYELGRLENQYSEQKSLTKKLEVGLIEKNSVENLRAVSQSHNLVAIEKVKYLEILPAAMAVGNFINP